MHGVPAYEASLDTWTSLFFVVSIFGLFFSSMFFLKGRHRLGSIWPIPILILGFSIVLFQYSLFWTKYIHVFPFLNFSLSAWFLSFGPLIYLYTSKFCNVKVKKVFLHFLPALICLVISFALSLHFYGFTVFDRDSLLLGVLELLGNQWVAVASMGIYLLLSKIMWTRLKQGSSQRIVTTWMRMLHLAFLVFILSYASYYILVQFPFFNNSWDYGIAVGMSLSVFTIGIFAYYEPALFNGEVEWLVKKKTDDDFSNQTSVQFYTDIVALIKKDELFLNGDLRLAHLSDAIGLPLHDASRIINTHSGKNFNQFINEFRVERAEQLLLTTDLSVKEICFVSGFNSKVTFYSSFKAKTNKTPVEYRKISRSSS